jgi:small subunit ribosomal protein S2
VSEPTAELGSATPTPTPSATAAELQRSELSVRELMEVGAHFGHQTGRWNPRMKPYLFGERNGVHIIDLDQTLPLFKEALGYLRDITAGGGKVLFVGTKRQAQAALRFEAERAGQFYVNNRWLGGMLTNFKTVKKSIDRFKAMQDQVANPEKAAELTKKELSGVTRQIEKYKKSLDGIQGMSRLPDALFVIDIEREAIAVSEARRLGIPIVAIVDSNTDPLQIDFPVPGNDDATRAILLYCQRAADACLEGVNAHQDQLRQVGTREEKGAAEEKPVLGGRLVVEIKQPPRRGRGTSGTASFGRDRSDAPRAEAGEAKE